MKEITIKIPDNCELKQDGNIYTIVEKEHRLNYDDIAEKLFSDYKTHYYIGNNGDILDNPNYKVNRNLKNNALSKRQLEKLLAINKLMNVAKYLNGDWQPNWQNDNEYKWYIYFSNTYRDLRTDCVYSMQPHFVYFKTKDLAKQAIEILGEETIKLALCTDY